jgi:hypothetical protein
MSSSRKSNSFSTFFGMLLVLAGLGAGVVLVTTPQLINQKAQDVQYGNSCALSCAPIANGYTSICPYYNGIKAQCCAIGYKVIDGYCVPEKSVPSIKSCVGLTDDNHCRSYPLKGGSVCDSGYGNIRYCCDPAATISLDRTCVIDVIVGTTNGKCTSSECSSTPLVYGSACYNILNQVKSCCPFGFKKVNNICVKQ